MATPSIMKHVELFRGLSDEQLKQVALLGREEVYQVGDILCEQDAPGDKVFIIMRGQVEIRVRDRRGTQYSAVYLGAGQVIGEMALVDEGKRSATVIAAEDETTVFAIPSDAFVRLCKTDTHIGYLLMRNIAQDLSFKLRHGNTNPSSD